jgi:hypothetical protein
MAKDKNRKKGIVDPRKAERASKRAASKADKAKADADLQSKVEKANTIAAAIQENRPEDTTPAAPSVTPPTEVRQLDADVKLGYADRPIARGERPIPTLDPETIAEDAVGAAAIREDERRQALVESGENLQPRTPLDVVKGIQERRAAAEQERVAGMTRVDLPSNVGEGFDEVTDAEAARRASGRTARRGTGVVDFRDIAGSGREGAGLTSEQEARAARRTAARAESAASAGMDVERRSAAEAVFGGEVEDWGAGQRPYTDKPEVMDLARRLKTTELMDQGKEITPEAVETGLQGGPHQRMARIIHHTGMKAEEVQNYIGGRPSIATDKLNELHETVMRNVRSRRKNDVLPRMGLVRGEDGSITATEAAQNETWQHPTEKDANGLPKTYKVSDMHPDMVKQLNHPWGGVQSENEFEGTSVLRETPAISDATPALRYANTVTKGAGDYMPVSIRFGHSKNAAGSWSFTPPPEGFTDSNLSDPQGFTSNVTHITDAIREGRTRPGTRPAHAERTKNLIEQLAAEGKRIGVKRQVTVPMPGFTQNGGAPATTTYKRDIVDIPKAGDDNIVTYDDLPHVKDANGNLVPLAPRSGVPGTGRSVHVVQGTMGLGRQFKSPAESSAEILGGAFGGADQPTPVRQEENRADAAAAFGGEVATDATEAIDKGPRSARSRSLVQGDSRVGKQFMGVAALPSRGAKQGIIPGFENYGNVERQRAIPEVFSTRTLEGPLPAGVDTRAAAGLTEKMTPENTPEKIIGEAIEFRDVETSPGVTERLRVPGPGRAVTVKPTVLRGSEAATLNTGLPDSRTLRLRAEAASGRPTIGAVEQPAPAKKPDYTQDELDFNPRVPGVVKTRQFMLGDIRTLTDAEQNVENVGANTIRGMNPPRANFDVGSPAATAARPTTQTPTSSGTVELSTRGGKRRSLAAGEKVEGTNVVVNSTKGGVKGKKSRPLKRPPNSAALAE